MTWFVAAISKEAPHNWDLCKKVGLFGISTQGRKINTSAIRKSDRILIWLGGRGFKASATITDNPRPPKNREETPWGGGLYRFGIVIPISVDFESDAPVWLGFENGKQIETGMTQFTLRKSFGFVPDSVGLKAEEILKNHKLGLKKS